MTGAESNSTHRSGPATSTMVWRAVKLFAAALLTCVLISKTDIRALGRALHHISYPWLIASILTECGAVLLLTALRYKVSVGTRVGLVQMMRLVVIQNTVSIFFLGSAGAVAYVGLLRGVHKVKVSTGVLSLIISRAGEVFAYTTALIICSALVWQRIQPIHSLVTWLCIATLSGLVAATVCICFAQPLSRLVGQGRLDRPLSSILSRAREPRGDPSGAGSIAESCLRVSAYSWAIAALMLCSYYFVYKAFGISIGFWATACIGALNQLLMVVPIHVLGGLGVSDIARMYLFGVFGVPQETIAPVIAGSRIVFFAVYAVAFLFVPVSSWVEAHGKLGKDEPPASR